MTTPFSLLTGNFKPSMVDLNNLILQLNTMFTDVATVGDQAVAGNLTVTGTSNLQDAVTLDDNLEVTGTATLNGGIIGGATADIAINTNKLTVDAATGDTLIAGVLTATGGVAATGLILDAHTALTAIGTDRASSLALTATVNNITTAAASTGVTAPLAARGITVIDNLGANPIKIYGAGADTIDGAAATVGVTLTNAKRVILIPVSATAFITLMGVASA